MAGSANDAMSEERVNREGKPWKDLVSKENPGVIRIKMEVCINH